MESIVFESKQENSHNIVFKCPFYIHCLMEYIHSENKENRPNSFKINFRNNLYDNFPYEFILHEIAKFLKCENIEFNIFLFENIQDIDILSIMINLFNHIYSCNFNVEINENIFVIKNPEQILFKFSI